MNELFDARAYTWRAAPGELSSESGPLSGFRMVVKDLFAIAGHRTGAGNPYWLATHPVARETSPVIRDLQKAGAQLIGKTLTDELAYSLNGVNTHYGTPLNPMAPERLPGGSSTGSAVAVAAGEAEIGLGSDTGGSIRVPASYNGLFGIRPTHGAISTEGMVPLAPLFDTVGWMSRDSATLLAVGRALLPGADECDGSGVVRVGVLEPTMDGVELWQADQEAWLRQQPQLEVHRRIPLEAAWLTSASEYFRVLQGRAIWQTHGDWFREVDPRMAEDIRTRLEWCCQLSAEDETAARSGQMRLHQDISAWFESVDMIVMPTTPGPAPRLDASSEWMRDYRAKLMGLTAPAGLAGLPQVHLPVITQEGAPAGVSLLGPRHSDITLLKLADALCGAEAQNPMESI